MIHPLETPLPATAGWTELAEGLGNQAGLLQRLSPAERLVAVDLVQGCSNREIAVALGKSEATVKHQVSPCLCKLGVATRARLIALLR